MERHNFVKVTELEWYLSIKNVFGDDAPAYSQTIEGEQTTLEAFHERWEKLRHPLKHDSGAWYLYAPFDVHTILMPGEKVDIPLGFAEPNDFYIMQNTGPILYSIDRIKGSSGAIGAVVTMRNVTTDAYELNFERDDLFAEGYEICEGEDEAMRLSFTEAVVRGEPEFTFYYPGLINNVHPRDVKWDKLYVTGEYDGESVLFHIQKQIGPRRSPLKDIIVETISEEEEHKYKIRGKKGLDAKTIFWQKLHDITDGDTFIIKKRYPLSMRISRWHKVAIK